MLLQLMTREMHKKYKINFTQVVWPKVLLNGGKNRIYFPCVVCRSKQIKKIIYFCRKVNNSPFI